MTHQPSDLPGRSTNTCFKSKSSPGAPHLPVAKLARVEPCPACEGCEARSKRTRSLPNMQKALLDKAPKDVQGDMFKQTVSLDAV
jgi:hypothetical protein